MLFRNPARSLLWTFLLIVSAHPSGPRRAGGETPPVQESRVDWSSYDRIRQEYQRIPPRVEPLMERLRDLRARYRETDDFESVAAERDAIRRRLQDARDEIRDLENAVKTADLANALPLTQREELNLDIEALSRRLIVYKSAFDPMKDFRRKIKRLLSDDDQAYQAAEAFYARRERLRNLALLGAAAACALVLGLWAAYRRSRPLTQTAIPFAARVELSGAMDLPGMGRAAALEGGRPRGLLGPPAPAGDEGGDPPRADILGGNFRIESEIGRGGMGIVYAATDLTLQRRVAIKRMRQEILQNQRELKLFLAEARLVASLRHPNVVEILSIVRESGQLFLVFEFVPGRSLQQLVADTGRLPYRQARVILRQIARGLDYAHSRKVIHRDLKPSNIMIDDNGNAKIMDFGIAHQAKKTVARLTRAEVWGTPEYMAPEQELGSISKESDLYALGVCFYEMVTGVPPFEGPNFLAQKRQMVFSPPSKRVDGLPGRVDALLRRALNVDPSQRFHAGLEFVSELEAVQAG
ncbi:MAG: protein kinase [Elusimicrobiota bacterium]